MKATRSIFACTVLIWIALTSSASLVAQPASTSFSSGTAADEQVIRAIVATQSGDQEDPRVAADLDWENAFGVRYSNLRKRNDWFNANIKPQFKDAKNSTLEVKVRFLEPTVAVADEYWHVAGQVYAGETKPGADRWGRTTYIFKKEAGSWIEVMERVADLRSAYFKHYDQLPAAIPVPASTLASYAGKYVTSAGAQIADVSVSGDHLEIASRGSKYVAIPTSSTEFLSFHPDDLASYYQIAFSISPGSTKKDGKVSMTLSRPSGELLASALRVP
jgi:hypothetical protein